MRYFKHPKRKEIFEVNDNNVINIYEREGFVECNEKGKAVFHEVQPEEEASKEPIE